jgi:preprotein translocase subunit YajC
VTTGGLHGRIVDVTDDTVTLEIAPNVIVRHERGQIGSVSGKTPKPQGRKGA